MSSTQQKTTLGGGIFLTLAPIIGYLIGRSMGETSLGLVIGLGVGVLLVGLIWLIQRRG